MKQRRFDSLTGLRAIAASMVFVYHNRSFWYGWLPDPVMRFFNEFHLGVAVFFVLSGFVIGYTYQEKPLQGSKNYLKYIGVRLARILPMYFIIVTAEFMRTGFPGTREILVAYTLTQGNFHELILTGLPQAWSLSVELPFYLIAPVLFSSIKKRMLTTLLVMLLLLGLAICFGQLLNHFHLNQTGFWVDPLRVLNYTFFGRFFEFVCGILIAQVVLEQRKVLWLQ